MSEVILQHHGVKGMKWGVRKKREDTRSDIRKRYDSAKAGYKTANKAYNKAFNDAYNYSNRHPISQYTNKKKGAKADAKWDTAIDKAGAANKAKAAYKEVKKERKTQIKETYKKAQKEASIGDKLLFSDGTRKAAAKYVVDNNMSMADARKKANKEAVRNTALFVGAYAAVKVGQYYANRKPQYSVLDNAGKVLKNFY